MVSTDPGAPVDLDRLDRALESAGIDVLCATSRQNVQYLLGGYRFFLFARGEDAIGVSRYVPAVGYPRGRPGDAFYVGAGMERDQQEFEPLWVPNVSNDSRDAGELADRCAWHIRSLGLQRGAIGVELPFLPTETYLRLRELLPAARFVNAVEALEEVRAVKRPEELSRLRRAADLIVDSMLACFDRAQPGMTTAQIARLIEEEEVARGLTFDYCFAATGPEGNRAPASTRWRPGLALSVDSGANLRGYIGDLARMAVLGPPSALHDELLAEVDAVQMAARRPVMPGTPSQEIYDAAETAMAEGAQRGRFEFIAHGMGMVNHEAPRISSANPWRYEGSHGPDPLEPGMVISIETTLKHPEAGLLKLEDALIVTSDGYEAIGDRARGWNVVDHG